VLLNISCSSSCFLSTTFKCSGCT